MIQPRDCLAGFFVEQHMIRTRITTFRGLYQGCYHQLRSADKEAQFYKNLVNKDLKYAWGHFIKNSCVIYTPSIDLVD